MKICTKCRKEKEDKEFSKYKKSKDGLSCWCKICCKEYYKNNAEKMKEQMKEWYKNNTEKVKKQQKEYRKNNAEKRKEQMKEWYKNNTEKMKEYNKEYNKNNVDKLNKQKKEYYKNNVEKLLEQKKEYGNFPALYNIYAHQISYAEKIRRDPENEELLQVKCTYCKEWFNPTNFSVKSRITALEGKGRGERRLYCSEECKQSCTIYNQKKYPKGQKPYPQPRDTQAQWADMVKERDEHKCVKCGSTEKLIAHHKEGIRWNPIESADIDMGVTLCKKCDRKVHKQEGCRYYDMRCV